MGVSDLVKPGVITGEDVQKVLQFAKDNHFALPAVNTIGTHSINAFPNPSYELKYVHARAFAYASGIE